jgi:hypothetical protein
MKRKSYDTVSEAISDLKLNGYTTDFSNLKKKGDPFAKNNHIKSSPEDFVIDHFFRFEGNSDPGDGMIVYAISSIKFEEKGILVNGYGVYADEKCSALTRSLGMGVS